MQVQSGDRGTRDSIFVFIWHTNEPCSENFIYLSFGASYPEIISKRVTIRFIS